LAKQRKIVIASSADTERDFSPRERGAGHHVSHVATVSPSTSTSVVLSAIDTPFEQAVGGSLDTPTTTLHRADSDGGAG
jgi:hypothetical protein